MDQDGRRVTKSAKMEIRMTPATRAGIEDAARREGVRPARWLRDAAEQRLGREAA